MPHILVLTPISLFSSPRLELLAKNLPIMCHLSFVDHIMLTKGKWRDVFKNYMDSRLDYLFY